MDLVMDTQIEKIKQKILPIINNYRIKKVGLFGSYIRNEMKNDSDIDILVELEKDMSLLDFVGLKLEIEEALGGKVDLVEYKTIKPPLKDGILKEQVIIL